MTVWTIKGTTQLDFYKNYSVRFCIQWFVMIIFSQVMLIIYKIMIIQFINYDSIDKINEDMIIFESNIYQQSLNENIIFSTCKVWNIKKTL